MAMITLVQWAGKKGINPNTARKWANTGRLPQAQKTGARLVHSGRRSQTARPAHEDTCIPQGEATVQAVRAPVAKPKPRFYIERRTQS